MGNSKRIVIILIVVVAILIIALTGAILYILVNKNTENLNNKTIVNTDKPAETNTEEDTNKIKESINNMELETFNSIFKSFEEKNLSSSQVKALFSTIESNNTTRTDEHKVKLDTTGITDIEQIATDKTYIAVFSYDDDGFINEIKVTEGDLNNLANNNQQEEVDEKAKLEFNTKFTQYLGEITGKQLIELLQVAQETVKNDPTHEITVSSNNLQNLDGIAETDIYIITLSHDTTGYVNGINIDKKM